MNKKLRLLVTAECDRHCPLCCNNRFDFDKIPVVEDLGAYDEIDITGGEPMLFPIRTYKLIQSIRKSDEYTGKHTIIYLYTAQFPSLPTPVAIDIFRDLDGICFTPHDERGVWDFIKLNSAVSFIKNDKISLRLNIFQSVRPLFRKINAFRGTIEENYPRWKVKKMKWIKDCPVPDGEDFRRIKTIWTK